VKPTATTAVPTAQATATSTGPAFDAKLQAFAQADMGVLPFEQAPEASLGEQLTGLFREVLGRDPVALELENLVRVAEADVAEGLRVQDVMKNLRSVVERSPEAWEVHQQRQMLAQQAAQADVPPVLPPEDVITGMYQTVLGREPDAEGFAWWSRDLQGQLEAGGQLERLIANVRGTFAETAEGQALAGKRAYTALVNELLGRAPDDAELAAWQAGDAAQPLEERLTAARAALEGSPEAQRLKLDRALTALYREVFDREPDPEGFAWWQADARRALEAGTPFDAVLSNVKASFKAGKEAVVRQRDEGIRALYREFLGREPDLAGFAYWRDNAQTALDRGEPLQTVLAGIRANFEQTAEGRELVVMRGVQQLYREVLRREPELEGLRHWTADVLGRVAASGRTVEEELATLRRDTFEPLAAELLHRADLTALLTRLPEASRQALVDLEARGALDAPTHDRGPTLRRQLTAFLDGGGDPAVAAAALEALARPEAIRQCRDHTCAAAAVEVAWATARPAQYFQAAVALATSGEVTVNMAEGPVTLRVDEPLANGWAMTSNRAWVRTQPTASERLHAALQAALMNEGSRATYDLRADGVRDGDRVLPGLSGAEAYGLTARLLNAPFATQLVPTVDATGQLGVSRDLEAEWGRVLRSLAEGQRAVGTVVGEGGAGHVVLVQAVQDGWVTYLDPAGVPTRVREGAFRARMAGVDAQALAEAGVGGWTGYGTTSLTTGTRSR
jgi:hypothetical protein